MAGVFRAVSCESVPAVTVSPSRAMTWLRFSEMFTGRILLASASRAVAVAVWSSTTFGRSRGTIGRHEGRFLFLCPSRQPKDFAFKLLASGSQREHARARRGHHHLAGRIAHVHQDDFLIEPFRLRIVVNIFITDFAD